MSYFNPNGTVSYGYYCKICGVSCNMYATGHGEGKCVQNSKLVSQLDNANPLPGTKPRFVLMADTNSLTFK